MIRSGVAAEPRWAWRCMRRRGRPHGRRVERPLAATGPSEHRAGRIARHFDPTAVAPHHEHVHREVVVHMTARMFLLGLPWCLRTLNRRLFGALTLCERRVPKRFGSVIGVSLATGNCRASISVVQGWRIAHESKSRAALWSTFELGAAAANFLQVAPFREDYRKGETVIELSTPATRTAHCASVEGDARPPKGQDGAPAFHSDVKMGQLSLFESEVLLMCKSGRCECGGD